ncbi:lymphotoxin-beta [Lithobates pipiens]
MAGSWLRLLSVLLAVLTVCDLGTGAKPKVSGNLSKGPKNNNWQTMNSRKPAAHLIGHRPPQMQTMGWSSDSEVAFTRNVTHSPITTLVTKRKGLYYVYCQVGFTGKNIDIRLLSEVITLHESTNVNFTLLIGSESITRPPSDLETWSTSLSQGGLASLKVGQKLYVHVSHPHLVDYAEGKTFFGLVMVS